LAIAPASSRLIGSYNISIYYGTTTQLSSGFMTNYPVTLNLSGSTYTSADFAGNSILFGVSGTGTYYQSKITGFNASPALNITTWWGTPSAGGNVFTNGVIIAKRNSNLTNIKGLGGVSYVGNSHPNIAPAIYFTGPGIYESWNLRVQAGQSHERIVPVQLLPKDSHKAHSSGQL
jgi:hypothetical protein